MNNVVLHKPQVDYIVQKDYQSPHYYRVGTFRIIKYCKWLANKCEACKTGMAESTSHVLECLRYTELRVGLDLSKLKDMVSFYREVMAARFLQF